MFYILIHSVNVHRRLKNQLEGDFTLAVDSDSRITSFVSHTLFYKSAPPAKQNHTFRACQKSIEWCWAQQACGWEGAHASRDALRGMGGACGPCAHEAFNADARKKKLYQQTPDQPPSRRPTSTKINLFNMPRR